MAISIGKIMIPLTIILCLWLALKEIDFFLLGGVSQPLLDVLLKLV